MRIRGGNIEKCLSATSVCREGFMQAGTAALRGTRVHRSSLHELPHLGTLRAPTTIRSYSLDPAPTATHAMSEFDTDPASNFFAEAAMRVNA